MEDDVLFWNNQEFLDRVEFSSSTLDILDKIEDFADRDNIDFLLDMDDSLIDYTDY
jgi:hypothetical protein